MSDSDSVLETPAGPKVDWGRVLQEKITAPTLQVVVNPLLRRGSPIHRRAFDELRKLGADYVRFVPWFPYPRLSIAELYPPADGKTSWDFTLVDPPTIDFLEATQGHSVMLNFSTIPPWMFKTEQPPAYPDDPDQPIWDYQKGTELRDPSLKEFGDYFARLVAWYTQGGFEDEYGQRHESGHHYKIACWEVLNEPDFEHGTTPEQYTERYDAAVSAIRRVAPDMQFVGLSLAMPSWSPHFFEHFLNPQNHRPGIPLDWISYHFYAVPAPDESLDVQQHTYFAQADGFLNTVRYVETIRRRLSPHTRTTINEIGAIRADDMLQSRPGHVAEPIPPAYWNLAAATYAYLFAHLAALGIDVAGESQLVGYPSQFPSVTMVDWNTGAPNARYRVLELLLKHFAAGGQVVGMAADSPRSPFYHAQAFVTRGRRALLLVNKRDRSQAIALPGFAGATAEVVDQGTAGGPARSERLAGETFDLPGLAVAVLTLPE
ncbi:MAG: hypothetical protein BWY52_00518 [Chloroflexi bacterium ADurb.Bin325]|nr:MAG: hypothetical protein BWY52_00518 [Chloroflexi bacterium ADurb.Bin325]